MNQIKCVDCLNFVPQEKFVQGKSVMVKHYGWCKAQSMWPAQDNDNQVAPSDAKRVKPGELAKMVPVSPDAVVVHCVQVIGK